MRNINISKALFLIVIVNFIVRLIAAYFYGDSRLDNEWGKLVHNLEFSGIFGINVVIDNYTAIHDFAKNTDIVLPSVFMPPLYGYLIYYIKTITFNFFEITSLIIFIQILISLMSIYIFFKLLNQFENQKVSLATSLVFSLFPIYIFSSVQISSVTIQLFLIIVYFFSLINFLEKNDKINLVLFSITAGLLLLTRGEFIIFYFLTIFYFFIFLKKKYKQIFISVILVTLILTPYIKRNFDNYGTFVLTKSFGFNLLKGNNPMSKVEGSTDFITKNYGQKILKIKTNKKYEINLDDFYKQKAIEIIKDNPTRYFKLYFQKIYSFLFIDLNSSYPNYYNILNILPKILISIFAFIGGIMSFRKKGFFQFLSIYYFANIFLFSIFFILPRYSLILLPIQILLSLKFLKFIIRKLNNKFLNNFFS